MIEFLNFCPICHFDRREKSLILIILQRLRDFSLMLGMTEKLRLV